MKQSLIYFILVLFFGLFSYVHSVLVSSFDMERVTLIGVFTSSFVNTFNLTLKQTSFQLSYAERVLFFSENILSVISISLVIAIPIFILFLLKYQIFSKRCIKVNIKLRSTKLLLLIKVVLILSLAISVIIMPRLEIFCAQGGIQEIKEYQLKNTMSAFYEIISQNGSNLSGNILTFKPPYGLIYYFPNNTLIDLSIPANLAYLKDFLTSESPHETVVKLREEGINYLLIDSSSIRKLDSSLDFLINDITSNPELISVAKTIGSWTLYNLGPYNVKKTHIPLSDWSVDSRYTNSSFILNSTYSELYLFLNATDITSRVTIYSTNIPKLDLSDFDYIKIDINGDENARLVIRFWLIDGSFFDVGYWKDVISLNSPFDLAQHKQNILRGDAYINLISSDGNFSSINISNIFFLKIVG